MHGKVCSTCGNVDLMRSIRMILPETERKTYISDCACIKEPTRCASYKLFALQPSSLPKPRGVDSMRKRIKCDLLLLILSLLALQNLRSSNSCRRAVPFESPLSTCMSVCLSPMLQRALTRFHLVLHSYCHNLLLPICIPPKSQLLQQIQHTLNTCWRQPRSKPPGAVVVITRMGSIHVTTCVRFVRILFCSCVRIGDGSEGGFRIFFALGVCSLGQR